MKNIILVIVNALLGILMLMIVMTVYGRMNRSMELQGSLSSIVEETMENAALMGQYSIHNTNEFLADVISQLAVSLDAESDIGIDVIRCDKERGILAVKVTAYYTHPNGATGIVSCERNVILNKIQE